jgi:hypothetical protein
MILQGQVGPQANYDGVPATLRLGRTGEGVVSELQGRFYENCYRNFLYSIGGAQAALSANTITLVAATTPIVGVWNPPQSPVNLVILQASCSIVGTSATAVGQGALVWASSLGNTAITTGSAPFSRKTMSTSGSQAKGFALANTTALSGLTNNLVVFENADFGGVGFTVTSNTSIGGGLAGVENFDGSLIVPPGGVLALLNTTSTTTVSASARLLWAELPL